MYEIRDVEGFKEFVKERFGVKNDGSVYPIFDPLENNPTSRDGKPLPLHNSLGIYPTGIDGKLLPFGSLKGAMYTEYSDGGDDFGPVIKQVNKEFIKLMVYHNSLVESPLKPVRYGNWKGKAPAPWPAHADQELNFADE